MRVTEKLVGYFRTALATKIADQKTLVKELANLSYADVKVRFEDTGPRPSRPKPKTAAEARAAATEEGPGAARGLLMGPFGRQTILKEVRVLNYLNMVNRQRAGHHDEEEKEQVHKPTRRQLLNNLGDAISKRHLGLVVNPETMDIKFV